MNKTAVMLLTLFMATAAYAGPGLNLPASADVCLTYPGATSYWSVTFQNIPAGYDIKNLNYPGWCADAEHTIGTGCQTCDLYSIQDDVLPAYAQDEDWDLITYMVNEYRAGTWSCATKYEIQYLVWYFLEQSYQWGDPDATCIDEIKADVYAYGEGFEPSAGGVATVLCDAAEGEKQLIFVEIPFPAPEFASALAAIALASPAFGYLLVKRKK